MTQSEYRNGIKLQSLKFYAGLCYQVVDRTFSFLKLSHDLKAVYFNLIVKIEDSKNLQIWNEEFKMKFKRKITKSCHFFAHK